MPVLPQSIDGFVILINKFDRALGHWERCWGYLCTYLRTNFAKYIAVGADIAINEYFRLYEDRVDLWFNIGFVICWHISMIFELLIHNENLPALQRNNSRCPKYLISILLYFCLQLFILFFKLFPFLLYCLYLLLHFWHASIPLQKNTSL